MFWCFRRRRIEALLLPAEKTASSTFYRVIADASDNMYLFKPFDKEELLVQLEMLVERQKRMAAYFSKNLVHGTVAVAVEPVDEEAIRVEDAFVQKVRQIVAENYTDEDFAKRKGQVTE